MVRAVVLALVFAATAALAQDVPREALRYKRDLLRESRAQWGMDAPVATFAAQIHQESGWRPDAKSKFAAGLTQFTPDTASWISGVYKDQLGENAPFNPNWAIRALVIYDRHLWERVDGGTECDRMAFTLSAYNGGLGWVYRDQKMAKTAGANPRTYFGQVEKFNSGRGKEFFKENRGYPQRILKTIQPRYDSWGTGIPCP